MSEQLIDSPAQSMGAGAGLPSTAAMPGKQTVKNRDGKAIYGSFWIDDTEFALPVGFVQEVVKEPATFSTMPLAPTFMVGLFNLRGVIIPIVDLRKLLGFAAPTSTSDRKVAIIEHGDLCIGLLFDRTGEVLNEQGAVRIDFNPTSGTPKDVVVEGLLKFDNGERIVQMLDPFELLNLEKIPSAEKPSDVNSNKVGKGKRLNCISFQVGHTSCAIDLRYVKEVREMPPVNETLLAHECIIGTANLRGEILPIVDFRKFMDNTADYNRSKTFPHSRKMFVLNTEGGMIGLVVYSIESIIPFFEHEVLPFARLAVPRNEVFKGCLIGKSQEIVMMLDHDVLRTDPTLVSVATSCNEIHPSEESSVQQKTSDTKEKRRTFILFTIGKTFALDTSKVSEVINYPDVILEPPLALTYVKGVMNLRGELITLINPHVVYGMPDRTDESQKVLIFHHSGEKYGILVDSIDEIVMTTSKSVTKLKTVDGHGAAENISLDVVECLQYTTPQDKRESVMILDIEAFVTRCITKQHH